jgi:hypothetical protein
MSLNLAHGSLDGDEPIFINALCKIRDAAKANNLPIMGFGISPSGMEVRRQMGWNAFIIHGDIDAICTSASQCLKEYAGSIYGDEANGAKTNGGKINGVKTNGVNINGVNINGVRVNGVKTNGVKINGMKANRPEVNGAGINGADFL